ncbi:hypothetical protein [Nocardia brasiliensis]|nr:hypothetical protein [Nocardia brasiliensis]
MTSDPIDTLGDRPTSTTAEWMRRLVSQHDEDTLALEADHADP